MAADLIFRPVAAALLSPPCALRHLAPHRHGIITAMTPPTLDDLRRHAVVRSLFAPTTLPRAIERLGFVQADPIRAPARAQDLSLIHISTSKYS